ncbi:AMP-dependent synthetase/ligase [Acetivibrio straminisolvens]|jgi:long-chain acyl-CoA synthetase|uniref:Long-chain-fatty-acid-CoA ligase n=1 Tax=Acetivibrio straminisolvens JCM 21531 TaxID=1294263 RepID=W4VAG3_9FIRM|nr:AMP-binding protein [Acetivibrio straminisolvens]GAE90182.1 long-chain-fatty-acid-CoA ligase [Acetivibrio straminisolvens JCM 21531]
MKNRELYKVRPIKDLKDMLNSSAELYGDKAAFLSKPKNGAAYIPISYKQLKSDVDAMGTALIELGLKNRKIALIGENRYEWSISYLSVVNGTGVIVPLDKELPANEIELLLKRSQADAIIYSESVKDKIELLCEKSTSLQYFISMDREENKGNILSFHLLLQRGHELLKEGRREFIDAEIDATEMSMLLFTSGTTEAAKAVMLSHKNVAENLMGMCSMVHIDEKDIFLSVLPIHHTYECTCGFLCQLYRGSTVAYCEGLRHIVKNLKESKATMMLGVPLIFESMYRQIMNQAIKSKGEKKIKFAIKLTNALGKIGIDIRKKIFKQIHEALGGHIRLFISGAAGIDPQIAKGFRELGISLLQGYGLTECSPIVALNRDIYYKDEAAGLPMPNLQVEIDSPDEDGIGEIKCKGSSVMLGYYENPEATAEVLKDGWFYTGDSGFIDEDGFIHITGRKKNVIITGNGKNVFPEEIETLLNRSPYIKESLVYGKGQSDGDTVICAKIVPDIDKIKEDKENNLISDEPIEKLIEKEVKNINKTLINYKHIKEITIQEEEFIKTTTKKIKRHEELKQ